MLSKIKQSLEKPLLPFIGIFAHVHPNILTLIGSIPSLLFLVCMMHHLYWLALLALIANCFDFLDGMVARTYHKATTFGAFLDSLLDRFADFFIIISFGFAGLVRWEIVLGIVLFAFLTSYIRSRGELASNGKVSFAVGLIERPERLIGIALALLLFILFPEVNFAGMSLLELSFVVLLILSGYTVGQRIYYAYKKL
jgi:phosphatidylglycerophosphate synthase